ncbi:MAG: stress response translation initiation inhibitor YciH [Pseudanabaenaceae cyanobacterium bins.68]|nr:stress response translation initiation inhibitor YciH [Pseudanabaenaceae cyanobacterium bins.68]
MAKGKIVYQEFGQAEPEPIKPSDQPVSAKLNIQMSRKGKGGKTVTIISGFTQSESDLLILVKKLKAQCGTGGTVKPDGERYQIEIQGDHRQKLLELLIQQNYQARAI